ncbi:MAG: phospho-sugar mutase [Firmicutes bacterium]|uniref:Phosphoglucomutase n=1 Tax=Candidatus Gallilactobacillus intestinavium TaxID=2840838 RepID=A0A9D9H591_9LACO|nr:phospho-sugar mutase [Candidatus Gallilactobacillus intestinavium]
MNWKTNYDLWLKQDLTKELRNQLTTLASNEVALENAFAQNISFGTAGMRGLMGPGLNYLNIYTVKRVTEGLANYIDDQEITNKQVVISYDSRINSTLFAKTAAKVLTAHGIHCYLFDDVRPTPELSYAVRYLHCCMGIMITASHNPKEFNGYKVYGSDGSQISPTIADMIVKLMPAAEDIFTIPEFSENEMQQKALLTILDHKIDQSYLNQVDSILDHEKVKEDVKNKLKIVYTPLHGTGCKLAKECFSEAGFSNVFFVKEQWEPDGNFPTVIHPNPEFEEAFQLAIQLAKQNDADIIFATDPDADRLGIGIKRNDGEYQLLTGNEIATLILNYLLTEKTVPENPLVIKSIVSTELISDIAKANGIKVVNVLTGFKFIAEKIAQFEKTDTNYLFGFEESYGYLIKPFVRDKDGIQSMAMLAEMAAFYLSKGQTLLDVLTQIYNQYGFYHERTIQISFHEYEKDAKIKLIMDKFKTKISSFNNIPVVKIQDYLLSKVIDPLNNTENILDLPKSNVMKFYLEDGSWIAVRPSGTEPKLKVYVEAKGDSKSESLNKLNDFERYLRKNFLSN